jgi:hypothetical protein
MAFKGSRKPEAKPESEMMRRFRENPLIFIGSFLVLLLVIVAFVFFPAVDFDMSGGGWSGGGTFGRYNGTAITLSQGSFFARQYDAVRQWYNSVYGGQLSRDMEIQVWREAFESTVVSTAILRMMQRAGFEVPRSVVDREMAALPDFQENGVFSPSRFNQVDRGRRLSMWRQVRDDITRQRFMEDMGFLLTPSAESEFIGSMLSPQRSFSMAVFSLDDFPDSQYEAFALENTALFRSASLSMMTLGTNEKGARGIMDSVLNGETSFADAAKTYSSDSFADMGGDMGTSMAYEMRYSIPDQTVLDAAFALSQGGYSDLLQMGGNWVFFLANSDPKDADLSDPAVMEKVKSYMRSFERGRMEDWAIERAASFSAAVAQDGFDAALAAQTGVESRSFGPVSLNFGSVSLLPTLESQNVPELSASSSFDWGLFSGGGLSGASSDRRFWELAFSTPLGTPSEPFVQGANVLVLLPETQTQADDSAVESTVSLFPGWISDGSFALLRRQVLNSPRFDNRFDAVIGSYLAQ